MFERLTRPAASAAGRPRLLHVAVALGLAGACVPAGAAARTIVGTAAADRLVGSFPGGDVLFGGGGADTLIGGPGNDTIYGVRSANTIDAGQGDNYVEGGTGDDKVTAGDGTNTIYTGSGHDSIKVGNGNNYIDPGGAPDTIEAGDGNNVFNLGSGGATLRAGNGSNTVYYSAGADEITLGSGVNTVWLANINGISKVDCGGNPSSWVYVDKASDPEGRGIAFALRQGKVVNCANIGTFSGPGAIQSRRASEWEHFNLIGDDGRDKLFGGHGGGTVDGKGGDNVLWADWLQDTGGDRARALTTRISATGGDNIVYGGRGTNIINVGNGNNFIRAGAWNNTISVGPGTNTIRLQGKGRNTITINGGTTYVESFANGPKPRITCVNGARGTVVYGIRKPNTNCPIKAAAKSQAGKRLQVLGVEHIAQSDPIVDVPLEPGLGSGVPRPAGAV